MKFFAFITILFVLLTIRSSLSRRCVPILKEKAPRSYKYIFEFHPNSQYEQDRYTSFEADIYWRLSFVLWNLKTRKIIGDKLWYSHKALSILVYALLIFALL